jgi:hypothetical protein
LAGCQPYAKHRAANVALIVYRREHNHRMSILTLDLVRTNHFLRRNFSQLPTIWRKGDLE